MTSRPATSADTQLRIAHDLRALADAVECAPDSDALNAAYVRAVDLTTLLGVVSDEWTERAG